MDCRNARLLLHPYFDGELDAEVAAEVGEHIEGCDACRDDLADLESLRDGLQRGALRRSAPDSLRQRLAATAAAAPRKQASLHLGRREWMALAASLMLAAALGVTVGNRLLPAPGAAPPELYAELLSSHLRALAAASPIDVASSDRHQVKPWFAGRVDLTPPVVDLKAEGFALVGGRVDYVGNRRVAALVYQRALHMIDVFILPAGEAAPDDVSRNGYNLLGRNMGDLDVWFVSDLNVDELRQFAELFEQRTR